MRSAIRAMVGSRFGLRVAGIFVLCALLPLLVASGLLVREFDAQLHEGTERELNSLVRGYGMSLIGRMSAADDVLRGVLGVAGDTGPGVDARLLHLEWVAGVWREPAWLRLEADDFVVLRNQGALLSVRFPQSGPATVGIVRMSPGGSVVLVELRPEWLWGDIGEISPDAVAYVLDAAGRRLAPAPHAGAEAAGDAPALSSGSVSSRWELFLKGRFSAESWAIVAVRPDHAVMSDLYGSHLPFPAIVAATLLLVTLLSLKLIRRQLRPLEALVEGTARIAQRRFDRPVQLVGTDEFAELANSFNGMADRLRLQFSTLDTLSEIDRLLLRSPGLEQILDSVLPRIAAVLGAETVSVVLTDEHSAGHGRAFDFTASSGKCLPVSRLSGEMTGLREIAASSVSFEAAATDARLRAFHARIAGNGSECYHVCALRSDDRLLGFLCVGYRGPGRVPETADIRVDDFSDRLTVVLAKLDRARQLYEQAHFDPLTGLANRQHFRDRLSARLGADGEAGRPGALLYIDLDHFKRINDTEGHSAGDEVLQAVARRLERCFDRHGLVARLGGDEFAVMLEHAPGAATVRQLAQRALESLRMPMSIDTREYRIEASIGVTLFPDDGRSIEDLLKNSDIAMYRAKESGRGNVVFFEREMQERMSARTELERCLHQALERSEFELAYQPIVDLAARRMAGVEALIRWPTAPDGPARSPAVFMPVAEESDLVIGIGAWVLRTACRQFSAWRREGLDLRYVSVNVSARQLRDPGFVDLVRATLRNFDVQPAELQLEITEGALADGPVISGALGELALLGVQLALDDFGTGYSSLSYLRQFPIHSVKIDRSFITGLPENRSGCRLVESIVAMTAALEKRVVAEGVETEAQLRFLQEAGCGSIQGWLFGRPAGAVDVPRAAEAIMADRRRFDGTRTIRRFVAVQG
jgi:diguanylate cyclase (GGDEF)-like protein